MASNNPTDGNDRKNPPYHFCISKVNVVFPVKPYKVQLVALVKIITSVVATRNALLELPTGAGKTLALLCGTLAWQRHELAELTKLMQKEMDEAVLLEQQAMDSQRSTTQQCLKIIKSSDDEDAGDFNAKPKNPIKMSPQIKKLSDFSQKKYNKGKTNLMPMKSRESVETEKMCNNLTSNSHEDTIYMKTQESKSSGKTDNVVEDNSDDDLEDFCTRPKKITKKEGDMKFQETANGSPLQQPQYFIPSSECTATAESQKSWCSDAVSGSFSQQAKYSCCSGAVLEPSSQQVQQPVSQQSEEPKTLHPVPRVPKIFYCSRTHSQLKQVVKELRKTEYKDVNMTILSSREFTCIQDCRTARNKNELCKTLLDPVEGTGCMYERNVSRMSSHTSLERNCHMETPWDIEDLVTAGRQVKACPYFAARELVASADIVFCPYTYIIDPKISSSMKLDITGAVIILDEAHNIEESCREAASYSVSCHDLKEAIKDCRRVATLNVLPETHNKLANFLSNLMDWITEMIKHPYTSLDYGRQKTENVFTGLLATANLEKYNIKVEDILEFNILTQEAVAETNREENIIMMRRRKRERYGIVPATSTVLTGLYYVLGFMYNNSMQHLSDYYVVISKAPVIQGGAMHDLPEDFGVSEANDSVLLNREFVEAWYQSRNYFLNFLCMNSAVIFRPISERARSIVLASGTLSPLQSYESELGAVFPNPISTSHIIGKDQVFVAAVAQSPKNKVLIANYANSQSDFFKDELGSAVLEICKCVPCGVLCFLPSYSLMKTLETRWIETRFWSKLEEHKVVMCEPRNSRDYPAIVASFQDCVELAEQGIGNGPLLFAVMRGKVSEGMNFTDNMARAVISVGIPYPHVRNILIILKKHYNSVHCKTRNLRSGEIWYETQAYRAINQALGRCIRHSKDWGALILIDQRFISNTGQIPSLSAWVNENVKMFNCYTIFQNQLKSFVKNRMDAGAENMKEENEQN